jgi:chromosome segregation ATPase
MAQPVVEEKTEYVTQASLDAMLQAIIHRIEAVDEANKTRIGDLEKAFNSSVAQVKADSLATMQEAMDERFEKEEAKRKSDIDSLKGKLRGIDSKLDEMQKGVSEIKGLMSSFQNVLKSRDEKDLEAHKRLDDRIDTQAERVSRQSKGLADIKRDIDLLTNNQAGLTNTANRLQTSIYGDPARKDDAPSLFGSLNDLKEQVGQGFNNMGTRLNTAINEIGNNRADIAIMKAEQETEKAQWAARWNAAKEVGKAVVGNRWVQLAIAAILTGIVVSIFPELRDIIVQKLSTQIQSGGQ